MTSQNSKICCFVWFCLYIGSCHPSQEKQNTYFEFDKEKLSFPEVPDLYFESIMPSDSLKAAVLAQNKRDSIFMYTHLKEEVADFTLLRIKNQSTHKIHFYSSEGYLNLHIFLSNWRGKEHGKFPPDEHLLSIGEAVTLKLEYPLSENFFLINPNYLGAEKVMPMLDTIKYRFHYKDKTLNKGRNILLYFLIEETNDKRHLKLVRYK